MGKVALHDVRLFARVGIEEAERKAGIELAIDVETVFSINLSAFNGEMAKTVNYALLAGVLKDAAKKEYALLEDMASEILQKVKALPGPELSHIRLRIAKMRPWIGVEAASAALEVNYPEDFQ